MTGTPTLSNILRWEGGPLELQRRQILGYPPINHELEEAIRDWYLLPTLEYLREAEIAWVWLTWSIGMPVDAEKRYDSSVTAYISECHRAGIQVLAEISAGYVLLGDSGPLTTDPWQKDSQGKPVPCSSSNAVVPPRCFQADLRNPQWKSRVEQRALAAIQAGADGIVLSDLSDQKDNPTLVISFANAITRKLAVHIDTVSASDESRGVEVNRGAPLVLTMLSRDFLQQHLEASWFVLRDGIQPGVRPSTISMVNGEIMVSGASQRPWIDSNLWLLRCCLAFSKGHPLLLAPENEYWRNQPLLPPPRGRLQLATAEATASGIPVAVNLEDRFRQGMVKKDPVILEEWKNLTRFQRFLKRHAAINAMTRLHDIAAVEDSCHDSDELLNLLSRRGLSCDTIRPSEISKVSFEAYRGLILNASGSLPDGAFTEMQRFVNAGGFIVTTTSQMSQSQLQKLQKTQGIPEQIQYPTGRGRWVIYPNSLPDADDFATEMKALLAPNRQLVRIWNAPTVLAQLARSANSNQYALHLLNYGIEPTEEVQIQVKYAFRKGEMIAPDSPNPITLKLDLKQGVTEFTIPRLAVYGLVMLE